MCIEIVRLSNLPEYLQRPHILPVVPHHQIPPAATAQPCIAHPRRLPVKHTGTLSTRCSGDLARDRFHPLYLPIRCERDLLGVRRECIRGVIAPGRPIRLNDHDLFLVLVRHVGQRGSERGERSGGVVEGVV